MSLATRCSACSTVFRVQQDQLKASEGWVRCGRCGTVFSALEGLFDLDREGSSAPMPLQQEPAASAPAPLAVDRVTGDDAAQDTGDAPSVHAPACEEPLPHAPMPTPKQAPVSALAGSTADEAAAAASFSASHHDPQDDPRYDGIDDDDDDDEAALLIEHSGHHTTFEESQPVYTGPAPLAPSFVREAERHARWQRPVVRRLTIVAALALPLLLCVQLALHHRDILAARWPASAELLGALCAPLDCSVQALRTLDAVSVESSGLTRVQGAALYRLQVAVRNQAAWAVAMPSLDLTLTDPRGEVVTRRVLRAAELGSMAPEALAPGAEWSALATIDVGDRRITGYTIELFYP